MFSLLFLKTVSWCVKHFTILKMKNYIIRWWMMVFRYAHGCILQTDLLSVYIEWYHQVDLEVANGLQLVLSLWSWFKHTQFHSLVEIVQGLPES